MYQSVDDIEETGAKSESDSKTNRLKLTAGVLLGITTLVGIAIYSNQNPSSTPIDPDAVDEVYAIYTKALRERDPALRRARLLDFSQTYPDHDRVLAADAQLQILNHADDTDWASVTEVVFDPAQSRPAKLAAIELYQDIWGTDLLGSREAEIADLRVKLQELDAQTPPEDEATDDMPNFAPQPDSFDPDVEASVMAGGIGTSERSYIPPNMNVQNLSYEETIVVNARMKKKVDPNYPRRAARRGVGAEVILSLNVDERGRVQLVELVSARAKRYRKEFVKSAERAALSSRFHPKTVGGQPVPAVGVIWKYKFQPDE